jgi:hypothetical protein
VPFDLERDDFRSGDGKVILQHEAKVETASYETGANETFFIGGTLQDTRHGVGTVFWMARNADCIPTQTLDLVMPVLGLYVNPGTRVQALNIDKLG